ncbi:MAG: hypothetical protein CVU05_03470 [Bacteroidetes bacterium HGW-Bacteroidetes-21]|jgi:PAS domain S-box-containing protein|nr:MAG: hypothetical protein CVU05_03470 [Bacteroidetes bacterium HGW-Bacteroidetes-21]
MKRFSLPLKLRLFLPVSIIIVVVVLLVSIWVVTKSVNTFDHQLEENLTLEVQTISKMFERESKLKLEKIQTNLKVASLLFNQNNFIVTNETSVLSVENQESKLSQPLPLKNWILNHRPLLFDSLFVDSLQRIFGGTVTIFQKTDSGFVRLSTNVLKSDGQRATLTFIPYNSPVSVSVLKGVTYFGRAFVVDDWYVSGYEPLYYNQELVGMIYVGDKEKDLNELKAILNTLKIGNSGYPFVFDKTGNILIHPRLEGENWKDREIFKQIEHKEKGILKYQFENNEKTLAFIYFKPFELYIAASVINDEESKEFKHKSILGASVIALAVILLLLGFIYYFTTDRIYRFFTELQNSRKKLVHVSRALEESEERFQKLFDSTGDDIFVTDTEENIVEINNATCTTLGYTREELLKMKITEIKSAKYKDKVGDNRRHIYEKGGATFESEHITKDGRMIPVEFISRLVSYGQEKLILSVVRNISQRKELERKILSAVILAEEKERSRFAKDMHDGLGPLLSTIKLYVNELKSAAMPQEERDSLIKSCNELIDDAVHSTRTISNNLMPRVIHSYGLTKAIDAFCEKVNKTNQLNIRFETENIENQLSKDMELILFRVTSELINNTIKHAQAKNVIILLVLQNEKLSLYFKDDGIGFNADEIIQSENKGMGLKNIISRIKSINGSYVFSSSSNEGFSIKIDITI